MAVAHPDPQARRAAARERLAARERRLRTLRTRAAGGAVAVFLAAWMAIYVPAAQHSNATATTASGSAATAASVSTDDAVTFDDGSSLDTSATQSNLPPMTSSQS